VIFTRFLLTIDMQRRRREREDLDEKKGSTRLLYIFVIQIYFTPLERDLISVPKVVIVIQGYRSKKSA
jgi:hypothetical protein